MERIETDDAGRRFGSRGTRTTGRLEPAEFHRSEPVSRPLAILPWDNINFCGLVLHSLVGHDSDMSRWGRCTTPRGVGLLALACLAGYSIVAQERPTTQASGGR